jgi:hypothetical protein
MARVIIVAAGDGTRWGHHLGVPKHLIPYQGGTILERLVGQFTDHDVTVVGPPGDPRYDVEGAKLYTPATRPTDADKFLSSVDQWSSTGRTIVVYGDIFLTDEAAATISFSDPNPWTLYARWNGSRTTGAVWGECFAVSFLPEHHEIYRAALIAVEELQASGVIHRSGGWEIFRYLNGARGTAVLGYRRRFRKWRPTFKRGWARLHEIDDWSDDFDYPEDYDRWVARRAQVGLPT